MNEAEKLAREFHETYERLAPQFGYETRVETRNFDPESKNGKLMVAVCGELLPLYPNHVAVKEEIGWLIEWPEADGTPRWWDGKAYIMDSLEAVRFAREEDANRVIQAFGGGDLKATEHAWVPAPNHVAAMEAQTGEEYQPEPAIELAPEQTVSKRQLESLVEDAIRYDAPHLTAFRIGKRVAQGLGFKVVEEG